jgi:hypothetical protein
MSSESPSSGADRAHQPGELRDEEHGVDDQLIHSTLC